MNATVGEITEADLPQVAEFLARQARPGESVSENPLEPAERLRWLLLENPARAPEIPFGWCIRGAADAVVGTAVCIPWKLGASGVSCTALMFSNFFVDPPYRGMGVGLLMRFVREGKRFPLFTTSANATSGALLSKVGAARVVGMDHTMLGVRRLAPLAEEFFFRKVKHGSVARVMALAARVLPGRIGSGLERRRRGELTKMRTADDVAALALPPPGNFLAVIRDRDYLHWRYFDGQLDKDVYRFHLPGEQDRMVVVNRVCSGYRGQIRVLNVLDIWPPATPVVATSLAAHLALQYPGMFDAIWFRSQSADVEAALAVGGWVKHPFPYPLGWYIDRENRLGGREWYLMPGESE